MKEDVGQEYVTANGFAEGDADGNAQDDVTRQEAEMSRQYTQYSQDKV